MDSTIYGQFFVLFAFVFTGYFLRKISVVSQGMLDGLNPFISCFAFPCMLIYKLSTLEMVAKLPAQISIGVAFSCALFVIGSSFSRWTVKLKKYQNEIAAVSELSMTAPNNGFMGLPIALLFFGQEGLLYMMCHNVALGIYIFTYGTFRLRWLCGRREKLTIRSIGMTIFRVIINPNILAMLTGFVICFGRIPLNNPFGTYLEYAAALSTPLAMIVIGANLTNGKMTNLLRDRTVWESSVVKLIILPALSLCLVYFLPVDPVMKKILVLAMALPTAAIVSVVVKQEVKEDLYSSKITFFTTIFSMATIPLWMKVLNWM